MKKPHYRLYFFVIVPLVAIILFLLFYGQQFSAATLHIAASGNPQIQLITNVRHPIGLLILQILVILTSAKVVGGIFKFFGQPSVIGEMVAGILLGPSLLGFLSPGVFNFIFPSSSLPVLQMLSQLGLLLFMFIIGMELDVTLLKGNLFEATFISQVSIILPYLLGIVFAKILYPAYVPGNVPFLTFALFMGIAMSITAFPVLARILRERQMMSTPVGSLAIICAAINDISGWYILAVVVAVASAGSLAQTALTILLCLVYLTVMLKLVRPFLLRMSSGFFEKSSKTRNAYMVTVFIVLLSSCFVTEALGIHALFGAFLAGAIMPSNKVFKRFFTDRIEDLSVIMLLPIFFAFTGLRTQIGLLNNSTLWWICALAVSFAVGGKFLGSAFAARITGSSWPDSLSIGALMNTRGLMELIVLNIGLELGILKPEIFTIMVIAALVTTFMTTPALIIIEKIFSQKPRELSTQIKEFSEVTDTVG